jgi:predicted dehydrogenase
MVGIGVIGYGYWGPNLVRNFSELDGARVAAVCDREAGRLERAARRFPGVRTTTDPAELIADPHVDAIVVATPVASHFELAHAALSAGKHVLVEKPMASSADECRRLIDEAHRRDLVLMVDHTFLYTGAVGKIRELIAAGDLGDVYYYDSVRVNLGLFQHDVNVIWDLAVHDLAILDGILPQRPRAVQAVGIRHVEGQQIDMAYVTLAFDGSLLAHLHMNWLAPVKIRQTLIGGSRRMIVYDDLDAEQKVRVYDKGIEMLDRESEDGRSVYKMLAYRRTGDMWAPKLRPTEALEVEARHFLACVAGREKPLTDGASGLRVVRILEAATTSMETGNGWVELPS